MPGITVKIERKSSLLEKLRKQVPENAKAITKDAAEDTARYIQEHWSPSSPSSPGEPPAVVTGMLDASVEVASVGSGNKPTFELKVQAYYASFLEFGSKKMAARPYMRPAMQWMGKQYKSKFKNVFKVK